MADQGYLYQALAQDLGPEPQTSRDTQAKPSLREPLDPEAEQLWPVALKLGTQLYEQTLAPSPQPSPFTSLDSLTRWGWEVDDTAIRLCERTWPELREILTQLSINPVINQTDGPNIITEHTQSSDFTDAEGVSHPGTQGNFGQVINARDGLIVAFDNFSPFESNAGTGRTVVPELRFWSDVVALQWRLRADLTRDKLQYVLRFQVHNSRTLAVVREVMWRAGKVVEPWPGYTVEAGEEAGRALMGTPNGSGVARLLAQHRETLGWRVVEKVTIFQHGSDKETAVLFRIGKGGS